MSTGPASKMIVFALPVCLSCLLCLCPAMVATFDAERQNNMHTCSSTADILTFESEFDMDLNGEMNEWKGTTSACGDSFCRCNGTKADCSNRGLTYVPELPNDTVFLDFYNNSLGELGPATLHNASMVKFLIIDRNQIRNVHPETFHNMRNLNLLSVSSNHLDDFGALASALKHVTSLKYLCVKKNRFSNFSLSQLSQIQNLKHLTLYWNKITSIERGNLTKVSTLDTLDIGTNLLTTFPNFCWDEESTQSALPQLWKLRLDWNQIPRLDPKAVACAANLSYLELTGNALYRLHANFFAGFPRLETLILMFCNSRIIESHAFNHSTLRYLDVSENLWFFDRVHGSGIDMGLFMDMPQLTFLNMSWTVFRFSAQKERDKVLSSVSHVTHFALEGTGLDFIPDTILAKFTKLVNFSFSKNQLAYLPDNTFENLTSLRGLDLSQNHLTTFSQRLLQGILSHSSVTLDLSRNPFSCTCDTLWFLEIYRKDVEKQKERIFTGGNYLCSNPESEMNMELSHVILTRQACMFDFGVYVAILFVSIFVVVLLVVSSLVYKFRWRLRFLMYTLQNRLTRQRPSGPAPVFKYDVFVSYDSDDNDWVLSVLRPELEDRRGLRLCLHERDFTPGRFISDNIMERMEESGAILPVLSNAFLRSDWCRFELFVAVKSGLAQAQRRVPMVPILLEELDRSSMDSLICALINTTTYLAWPRERGREERERFWVTLCGILARNTGRDLA